MWHYASNTGCSYRTNMPSTLVYDILQTSWVSTMNPTMGVVITALGCVMIAVNMWRKHRGLPVYNWRRRSDKPDRGIAFLVLAYGLVIMIGIARMSYVDYTNLRTAYESGQCKVVEGTVEHFHAVQTMKNAKKESFDIGSTHFAYPDSGNTAAFSTTAAYGGPMRNGLPVRIHHCNGDIVRLEVFDDGKPKN